MKIIISKQGKSFSVEKIYPDSVRTHLGRSKKHQNPRSVLNNLGTKEVLGQQLPYRRRARQLA